MHFRIFQRQGLTRPSFRGGFARRLARASAPATLALVASALAAGLAHGADELDAWHRGPIRYLALKEEIELYRKLETDEQRALFIERFWARRDPTPDTMTNEYRELFWQRVRYANERFLDSAKQGWQTDRGKVHILYGEPSEIEDHHDLRSGGDMTGGHGVLRWIYRGRPGGRTDLDPIVIVPFQRDVSGEYRLSTDPELSSVFFDALSYREQTPMQRALQNFFGAGGRRGPSQLAVMLDLGKMQEVPPHAQVILERVETLEDYKVESLDTEISRFRHPERSGTLAVLTVDVSHVPVETVPALVAKLTPREPELPQRVLAEGAFAVVEVGGRRFAQGRVVLQPGVYDLMLMVVDPLSEVPGVLHEPVEIPDLGQRGELRFSDVVLAADIVSLRFASLASYDEPYHVGPFRVVPRIGDSVAPGSPVRLFYEIYEGHPPYQVAYVLEGQDHDGSWKRLGHPFEATQEGASQAWELTTGESWPLGNYRVRIQARDQDGRSVESIVPFVLEAPPTASSELGQGREAIR